MHENIKVFSRHVVAADFSRVVNRNEEKSPRTKEERLRKSAGITVFNIVEIDLVEALPSLAIENQDLVRVLAVRAEARDIEIPIGAKNQAFGPVEMPCAASAFVLITGKNVEKAPGIRVKAQNPAYERTKMGILRVEITDGGNIEQSIGAEDYPAGMKLPELVPRKTIEIEIAKELPRGEMVLWHPALGPSA
jgi:hypothetical protein